MKKISIDLEWGGYPIQELDKDDLIIDDIGADELGFDKEFCKKVQKLQNMYNDLFIDNEIEFAYIGDKKPEEVKEIKKLYKYITKEIQEKLKDKYEIQIFKLYI